MEASGPHSRLGGRKTLADQWRAKIAEFLGVKAGQLGGGQARLRERLGERVAAVVSLRPGASADPDALREHCRMTLAGYKVPVRIEFVAQVMRSPVGKADYRWARAVLSGQEPAPAQPS